MDQQEQWQVSGSAAEKYEHFVALWFVPWAADLVERADIAEDWSILDLACGTGVVTRAAAQVLGPAGSITASDLNEGMLAEARRQGAGSFPVEWRQADASSLPFEDDSFDAVLCQEGLQFVPDKRSALSEMRRVLRPGGVAAVSVWREPEHNPYLVAMADGLRTHLSVEAGQVMLAPCALGNHQEFADLFDHAGFSTVDIQIVMIDRDPVDAVDAINGNLAAMPIADQIEAMDPARYDKMIDQIVASLDDLIVEGVLIMTSSALIAVAHV